MRPLNEYILDNFNGKLGLPESYEKYAQDVLSMIAFTFNNLAGYFFCVKCDEFEKAVSETGMGELIEHAQAHETNDSTDQGTFLNQERK